ncbi:MAG: PIN domain-containing protein, partial [Verrucomicrobia bacterium]|nr:PIN domain-containing protein [Verrucomicrobiota bacterium]
MPSTPTEALLDVNVVVAAVFEDHVMHAPARRFVETLERFFTTPTTQGGFLRFATRPWKNERKEEQPPRLSMADAQARLREFTQVEGHVFLP